MRHLFSALLLLSIAVSAPAAGPIQGVARRFVLNFATNRLEAATGDFNEQLKSAVTPAVLVTLKEQLDRDFGHFRAVGAVRESTSGRFPLVEVTAQFEKGPALFQVTFDGEGRIGALHFGRAESSNPELERVARQVLDDFNARRFAEITRRFDQKMSAQLPLPALESLHASVTDVYGTFKAVTEVHYAVEGDLRVVSVFAAYEKQPMLFECVFNAAGRIVGWTFRPPKPTISGS